MVKVKKIFALLICGAIFALLLQYFEIAGMALAIFCGLIFTGVILIKKPYNAFFIWLMFWLGMISARYFIVIFFVLNFKAWYLEFLNPLLFAAASIALYIFYKIWMLKKKQAVTQL